MTQWNSSPTLRRPIQGSLRVNLNMNSCTKGSQKPQSQVPSLTAHTSPDIPQLGKPAPKVWRHRKGDASLYPRNEELGFQTPPLSQWATCHDLEGPQAPETHCGARKPGTGWSSWLSGPAIPILRKPGVADLTGYLGHLSKLGLDVLLAASSQASPCRRGLLKCLPDQQQRL